MNNDQLYALYLDAYARSAAARLAIALGVRDAQERIAIMGLGAFLKSHQKLMATDPSQQDSSLVASIRAELHKLGIVDPSTPLLRAALLHEHMKAARDLAYSNLVTLNINVGEVSHFDEAEALSLRVYRYLLRGSSILHTKSEKEQA